MTAVGPRMCPLYYSRHVGSLPSRFRPYVVNLLGRPWSPRQARSQQNIDINPSRHHLQTLPQTIPYCHPLCPISNFSKVRINRHIHHPRTVTGYSILLRYSIFSLKKKNSADPNRIFSFFKWSCNWLFNSIDQVIASKFDEFNKKKTIFMNLRYWIEMGIHRLNI